MRKNSLIALVIVLLAVGGAYYYKNFYQERFHFEPGPIVSIAYSPDLETPYLADSKGRTLYRYSADADLKSNCTGQCLDLRPLFEYNNIDPSQYPDLMSKRINIIKRPDGYLQFAYGLSPLYYYGGDLGPGSLSGMEAGGRWSIVPLIDTQ